MSGRAGKSFSLSLPQSKLRKNLFHSKAEEMQNLLKFHIGTTEAETLHISELLSLSQPLG